MQITGTIKVKKDLVQVSDSFCKQEIVVTVESGKYPQQLLVQFTQDSTDLIQNFNVGDNVTIDINLNGREWVNPEGESKFFNSIDGWRIAPAQ